VGSGGAGPRGAHETKVASVGICPDVGTAVSNYTAGHELYIGHGALLEIVVLY
jgi:hypothetical protein